MLTLAICEDESWFAADLKKKAESFLARERVDASIRIYTSGEELLEQYQSMDIVLMDVKLPGKSGMDIAGRLRAFGERCQIIFITAWPEYVFQAFDMDAVHYLLKPVSSEKLDAALDKAIKRISSCDEKTYLLSNSGSMTRIFLRDILYCEVFDHRLFIHTRTKNEKSSIPAGLCACKEAQMGIKYETNETLDSMERKMDGRFFRCHRSYLVNMDYVTDKEEGYAIMAGGGRVLISRRRQQEFTKRLLQACRMEGPGL